jgi:hypothetical protein
MIRPGAVCLMFSLVSVYAAAQEAALPAPPDAAEIVRNSLEKNTRNEERRRDYTYTENEVTRTLDKSGAVVKTEQVGYDVVNLYGRPYRRRVSKDGKALEGKEKQKADDEFEKEVRKREGESPQEREKREAEQARQRAEEFRFLQEIPKAYTFHLAGEETLEGAGVWVIDAQPRPDFRSSVKRSDLLKKLRGRLWIDKESGQWVRVEAEVVDPISFGGFLAKLDRGATLSFLQHRVNDEIWLPSQAIARLEARVLVKRYRIASETTWSGYRKFRVESHIVAGDSGDASRQ